MLLTLSQRSVLTWFWLLLMLKLTNVLILLVQMNITADVRTYVIQGAENW